jgi:hypothetical protein
MYRLVFVAILLLAQAVRAETLFVASNKGVREVGLDGKTLRELSKEPASWPRLLPGKKTLAYVVQQQAVLRIIRLTTGSPLLTVKLPQKFSLCKRLPDSDQLVFTLNDLHVQELNDFVIDESGKAACMTLMDRNTNMLSISVKLRIPLVGSGQVQWAFEYPSECAKTPPAPCEAVESPASGKNPPPGRYDIDEDGFLVTGNQQLVKLGTGDFRVEPTAGLSPGGKWALIGGNVSEGDYIHRTLFLLGRRDGKIRTIAERSVVLTKPQLATMSIQSIDAVGESDIRWLNEETLLIDSHLISPGKGWVNLGGDVAR